MRIWAPQFELEGIRNLFNAPYAGFLQMWEVARSLTACGAAAEALAVTSLNPFTSFLPTIAQPELGFIQVSNALTELFQLPRSLFEGVQHYAELVHAFEAVVCEKAEQLGAYG